MIVDQFGNEVNPDEIFKEKREPCVRCGGTERALLTGFGGHWRINCTCGNLILQGRGDPPREGEY